MCYASIKSAMFSVHYKIWERRSYCWFFTRKQNSISSDMQNPRRGKTTVFGVHGERYYRPRTWLSWGCRRCWMAPPSCPCRKTLLRNPGKGNQLRAGYCKWLPYNSGLFFCSLEWTHNDSHPLIKAGLVGSPRVSHWSTLPERNYTTVFQKILKIQLFINL